MLTHSARLASAAALLRDQMRTAAARPPPGAWYPRGRAVRVAAACPPPLSRHLWGKRAAEHVASGQNQQRTYRWQGGCHQGAGAGQQGGARAYGNAAISGLALLSAAGGGGMLHAGVARADGMAQVTSASDGPEPEPATVARNDGPAAKLQQLLSDLQTLIMVLVAKGVDGFYDLVARIRPLVSEALGSAKGLLDQLQPLLADCIDRLKALVSQYQSAVPAADSAASVQGGEENKERDRVPRAAGEEAAAPAPVPAAAKTAESEQSFYQKYGWLIIAGSIIGAGLGVLLSRRALEAESAKIIAQRTEEAVRSTMPAHPRRASVGGPLQNSQEHAALVRDALDILAASVPVAAALGTPPFKEGRLQAAKGKGAGAGGNIAGKLSLKGPKGTGSVAIRARRSDNGMECEDLVVTLPSGETIEVPIVSDKGA